MYIHYRLLTDMDSVSPHLLNESKFSSNTDDFTILKLTNTNFSVALF